MDVEYQLKRAPVPAHATIDYAKELNPEQLAAVTAPPGPLLIIAGAGSGKTRTLTYRVAYLIENGVEPENILLLTFTNKASREMLERVGQLLPHDISRIWGGTFHSVGNRLLRRHANEVGYGLDFTIMDREDAKELLTGCFPSAGVDPKEKSIPKADLLLEIFSLAINKELPLRSVLEQQYPYFLEVEPTLETLFRLYADRKRTANLMDYDDLLSLSLRVLRQNPALAERYQTQFQHILVDEYQDTNKIQADFIDMLGVVHQQVMVVGDDAQSIYSWRGANFQNILSFPERYEGAKTILIETNYRSTPEILNLANTIIAGNTNQFAKALRSIRPADKQPKPALVALPDANLQAHFICQRVLELHEEGMELNDIAVLYRSHFHAMELQMELTRQGIPFQITSGLRFFEQAHIKDVAAYLKLAVNPKDEVSFKRIAQMLPAVGAKTADKLWAEFAKGKPLGDLNAPAKAKEAWTQWAETQKQLQDPELKNKIAEQIGVIVDAVYGDYMKSKFANYSSRLEDLGQLKSFSRQFESLEDFLAQLTLMTNAETTDAAPKHDLGEGQAVRLSSVHQAKGLEWKCVFVIMLCDGLFPNQRASENLEGEEEERRLFYVAVTRARDELYLTYPLMRATAGSGDFWQRPSRFVEEFPMELVNRWKIQRPSSY